MPQDHILTQKLMASSYDFGDMSDEEGAYSNAAAGGAGKKKKKKKKSKKKKAAPAQSTAAASTEDGMATNAIMTALKAEGFSAGEIQATQDAMWDVRYVFCIQTGCALCLRVLCPVGGTVSADRTGSHHLFPPIMFVRVSEVGARGGAEIDSTNVARVYYVYYVVSLPNS